MSLLLTIITVCFFVLLLCLFVLFTSRFLGQSGEVDVLVNKKKDFRARKGIKFLDVLADNKIYLPAACGGKGNCGRCKIKVLAGGGYLTALEKLYLTDKELSDGFRLACQIKTRENISVYLSENLLLAHNFKAQLVEIDNLAFKIKGLHFKLEKGESIDFKAGQYVQIMRKLPWENVIRAYSISSSPDLKDEFSLDVQLIEGGLMSSYLHSLDVGTELEFCGPFGEMTVDEDKSEAENKTLVLVAGGVGLAPMRSIVSYLLNREYRVRILLFHGVKSRRNLYNEDEYRNLMKKNSEFEYIPVLAEPSLEDGWVGKTGLVTEILSEWLNSNSATISSLEAFLCGPSAMMKSASKLLAEKGVSDDKIHSDPFSF